MTVTAGAAPAPQRPVTENQEPSGEVTNTIGARQGDGSATFASIFESPLAVAGAGAVETFTIVGTPSVTDWQLTIARNRAPG